MRPHIAYILKMYPRFSETFIVNEILELERQGVDVRIYSLRKPDDGRFHASLARVRANVIYAPQYPQMEPDRILAAHRALQAAFPERYRQVRAQVEAKGHIYAVKRFLQAGYIAEHLLRHPVDGVHAHFASSATRVANLVHRLIGMPYSFTAHAKDIFHESVRPESLRIKIREARFVVTVSRFNQRYLQALNQDGPGEIRCLYNGIDLERFRPTPGGQRPGNRILAVGRLVEKKGFGDLIRACHLLTQQGLDFRCQIIGKGPLREELSRQIQALGLTDRVKLLGPRPQDQVLEAYHQADLFVLPCIVGQDGNRDGLPTVLLEAMATGLPVISTELTGVPEIIDAGRNGLLTPPGDVPALAHAMAQLLGEPERRRAMGAAARAKVEREFDVRRNVAQLRAWLTESAPSPMRATHPAQQPRLPEPSHTFNLPSLPVPGLEEVFAAL